MKKITIGLFLLVAIKVSAQTTFNTDYVKSYWTDGISIAKAPFQLNDKTVAFGSAYIAAFAYTMTYDAEIASFFQRNKSPITKDLAAGFQVMGNGTYCFPAMGVLYLAGVAAKNKRMRNVGLQGFKALVIGGGITEVIKVCVERERPFQNNDNNPYVFHGLFKPSKFSSFPSGHTFDAFTIATVVSQQLKNKWWNIPLYTAATCVGLSRIHDDKHWASDVLMGAAIGYCVSKVIMNHQHHKVIDSSLKF